MLELKVKDIRETFEETLGKFYALADFSLGSTKVMDKDEIFRIEFRIYDTELWMDVKPSIDSVRIATRSLNRPDLDTIQIWLSKPYDYDKAKFKFGWRNDLEAFFDAFHAALLEKLAKTQKTTAAGVYGSSASGTEISEDKAGGTVLAAGDGQLGGAVLAAIFNGLDDRSKELKAEAAAEAKETSKDDEDEYI